MLVSTAPLLTNTLVCHGGADILVRVRCAAVIACELLLLPRRCAKVAACRSSHADRRGSVIQMLSEADRKKAADILIAAEKERRQAVQLSNTWPDITLDDSYAISREVAKRKMAGGARLIGHK